MIPLLQTARELLQTQPTLHPKIFGADERLLPDVRQKIMKTADFMIRQRVSGLYGLKVADIVIVGSAGGYMLLLRGTGRRRKPSARFLCQRPFS